MVLNNRTLQELIAKCLFGGKWKEGLKFIVPRKGNFLNPQLLTNADTYAIYYIDRKEKRITNLDTEVYGEDTATVSRYATVKMKVVIQFIGLHAEEWANTLMFWDERSDIQNLMMEYQSQLLPGDRIVETVPFQQDGYNGEMSYLASFETISNVSKEESVGYMTVPIWLKGSLIVEK